MPLIVPGVVLGTSIYVAQIETEIATGLPLLGTTSGLIAARRATPVGLSTMGRGLDADPAYFLTSAAAGRHAAALVT